MKPFYVLLAIFGSSLLIINVFESDFNYKLAGKIAISVMLIFTAMGHFRFTKGMAMMIPKIIPAKTAIVYFTGTLEIFLAVAVFIPKISQISGILMIAFFILVLPANIFASMKHINYESGKYDGKGLSYLWFRIPCQILLIFWVYYFVLK